MSPGFFDRSQTQNLPPDNEEIIDKQSKLPAYIQLASILKQRISSGDYQPGSRLPSETSLAKNFGLSAMTARQAVGVLVEEGLVRRVQGSGTFVRRIDVAASNFGLDALRDIFLDKDNIDVRILKATVESAEGAQCEALNTTPNDPMVVIERLIMHKGHPFTLQTGYARFDPESPIVETMLDTDMLTGLFFENSRSCFMKGELRLLPTFINDKEANLLETKCGECAFKLEHLFYDFSNRPASYGWFIVSPEKMPLISKVGIWNE